MNGRKLFINYSPLQKYPLPSPNGLRKQSSHFCTFYSLNLAIFLARIALDTKKTPNRKKQEQFVKMWKIWTTDNNIIFNYY